jgi:hypothetical protein
MKTSSLALFDTVPTTGGKKEGLNYRSPAVRKRARTTTMLRMFIASSVVSLFVRLYRLTLLDKVQVTLQLTNILYDLVLRILAGPPFLAGGGGAKKFFTGVRTRCRRLWFRTGANHTQFLGLQMRAYVLHNKAGLVQKGGGSFRLPLVSRPSSLSERTFCEMTPLTF